MKTKLCLVLLFVWNLFWIIPNMDYELAPRNDDCLYLMLSKSFTEGKGYSNLAFPEESGFIRVPSGFPLLLMPYWWFAHPNIFLLKAAMGLLAAISPLFLYLWLSGRYHPAESLLLSLSLAPSGTFLWAANSVLTEIPFLFVLYLSIWLLTRAARRPVLGREIIAICLTVVLAKIRVTGVFFLIGVGVFYLVKKRYRTLAAGALLFIGWSLLESYLASDMTEGGGYLKYDLLGKYPFSANPLLGIQMFIQNYFNNLSGFAGSLFANLTFPWFYHLVEMNIIKRAIVVLLFFLCLGGAFFWTYRNQDLAWVPLCLLLMCAPLFTQRIGTLYRHLFPLIPFFAMFILEWKELKLWNLKERFKVRLGYGFLVLFILGQGLHTLSAEPSQSGLRDESEFAAVHKIVNEIEPPPQFLLSPQFLYTYLKTGVKTYLFRQGTDFVPQRNWLEGQQGGMAILHIEDVKRLHQQENPLFQLGLKPIHSGVSWTLYPIEIPPEGKLSKRPGRDSSNQGSGSDVSIYNATRGNN